jgi:hypothetical protein
MQMSNPRRGRKEICALAPVCLNYTNPVTFKDGRLMFIPDQTSDQHAKSASRGGQILCTALLLSSLISLSNFPFVKGNHINFKEFFFLQRFKLVVCEVYYCARTTESFLKGLLRLNEELLPLSCSPGGRCIQSLAYCSRKVYFCSRYRWHLARCLGLRPHVIHVYTLRQFRF